ncbi:MAG TPA: carbamoyltransferase N-terminal domain-containing protein [Opitutaceae bacterium]
MRVLGISAFYHDSAAALIEDGVIVAAAQEERFTRRKHDPGFPHHAVKYCLSQGGGAPDAVVFYEKPLLKFERILSTAFAVAPSGFRAFAAAMPSWLQSKLWIPFQIEEALRKAGHDVAGKIYFSTHHQAHAASAFFPSPFESAAFLTLDGVGEWTTTSFGVGSGNQLTFLKQLHFPDSLGLLYSAFTYFCGFRVNSGEYKLMGLAPYGEPRYADTIFRELLDLRADGSFRLNQRYFDYLHGERMTNHKFAALFGGPARRPESPLTRRECDLARSIQTVTEEIVMRMARTVQMTTGASNLCLAGGVALNCVANGKLLREGPFKRIWIQPAAGDAGGALGAALAFYYQHEKAPRERVSEKRDDLRGSFLGPTFSDDEIGGALKERGLFEFAELIPPADRAARVAKLLSEENVVGFFQGRAEFGPRALGARSILADARSKEMQRVLNLKIKFRESFRPFAPIVLAEKVTLYFELSGESPYMLLTAPVRVDRRVTSASATDVVEKLPNGDGDVLKKVNEARSDLPAITHVDYSARIQTVDREVNPTLHEVLLAFERLTSCAVLINTSFNVRGEPPVGHPRDAIAGFLETDMDALAIGGYLLEKRRLPAAILDNVRRRHFAAD